MHSKCHYRNEVTNREMKVKGTLIIRVGKDTLSFTTTDPTNLEEPVTYEPYTVKSGISMSANLREAFKERSSELIYDKTQVIIDSKVLMIPIERFSEGDTELYYKHSFPADSQQSIAHNVIPELNSVAVFSINKDVRLVLRDNVPGATVTHLMIPVWHHMFTRSFTGHRNKLYAYFHDKQLEVFSFQQNRFKFCNSYDASLGNDSLYFLLYVWKQLNLQPEHDEMLLCGDIPQREWLLEELRRYLHNAYVINPSAEFNRTPATRIKDMPFDLVTLLTKGR